MNSYYVGSTCSVLEQSDPIQPPQQPCEDYLQVKRPLRKNGMAYPRVCKYLTVTELERDGLSSEPRSEVLYVAALIPVL